jgi:hypothetical protein
VPDLVAQLIKTDNHKIGRIKFDAFTEIIHNLDIPISLINDKQLRILFSDLGGTKEDGIANTEIVNKVKQTNVAPEKLHDEQWGFGKRFEYESEHFKHLNTFSIVDTKN